MNAEIKLKIVAGLVASLILIGLCYAAYLSGPIGRRHAVFFFGVLAVLVFLDWRKARRRKPDSCINCQRDAQFCLPCCDAIGKSGQPSTCEVPEVACRVALADFMRDWNVLPPENCAERLFHRLKRLAADAATAQEPQG